jgi:glycosyltransferase involved in cell wall biosynthesis
MTRRIDVRILTPFGAASGMGNWRTAQRYAQMLRASGISASIFEPHQIEEACADSGSRLVAIALNAKRSAREIDQFKAAGIPLLVALTGTDLYQALQPKAVGSEDYQLTEAALLKSDRVLTLQSQAQEEVLARWPALKDRVHCIMQTASPRQQHAPRISSSSKTVRFLIAAHIRKEKDPVTAFLAFHHAFPQGWAVQPDGKKVPVRLMHVGGHKDKLLAHELIRLGSQHPGILLEGPLTHAQTLRLMTRVHALIQPSISEGGALVVPEAIACRLPVIASDIPAHRGQLGNQYPGLFAVGSVDQLAGAMARFVSDAQFQQQLCDQTINLAPVLASPAHERNELVKLVRLLAKE